MKKIYRHVKFYIKTSLKSIRRHIGMTLSAAMAVSITLILISMFMLIGDNLKTFTYHIEKQLTIRVSIDNVATQKEKEALMADIKKMDGVKKVTFSSGKKELEEYKKEYKESNHLIDMYDGKSSPIRDALIVDMENANQIDAACKEISTKKNVISADYGGDHTDEMISVFASIRSGSMIFIVFLVLIAALLIGNKIKMSIYTRREEIAVMRNVGASNWFIKAPMMLEGMLIGFFGSIIPVVLTIFGYQYLYQVFHGVFLSDMFQLQAVYPMTIQISLILIGIGMVVGLVGSFLSTTKYLRWKR